MLLCDSIPDLLVPVLQDMMLMSLSCMELQLDQWLLTKGRSSAGRSHSVFFSILSSQEEMGVGSLTCGIQTYICSGHISWVGLLD